MSRLKYTCLFGGGAIRGISYIGAIRALEELNIDFDIIGGSSVGAIFAAMLACGYKSYELESIFMKVNFELFKDIHFGLGNFAISKGEIFVNWLNELLSQKITTTKTKKPTFRDLDQELVIITTDLKKFKPVEFSKSKTPDFEIAKAVRISSSMPGLMPPFAYQDGLLVDGDLQKSSPMWKLSETASNSKSRILEFRLEGAFSSNDKNPLSFINTIYSCITDVSTDFIKDIYQANDRYDYIKIGTGDIFFADFNLNKEARRELVQVGYKETINYFKEILPVKKQKLEEIYSSALKYLKSAQKGLKANDVEEVQWWLGDLFILLCENKEIIDPNIYKLIQDLKQKLSNSVKTILFFHSKFSNRKDLEEKTENVIEKLNTKVTELKIFCNK